MNINLPKTVPRLEKAPVFAKKSSSSSLEIIFLLVFIFLFGWFVLQPKSSALSLREKEKQALLDEESSIDAKVQTLKKLIQEMKQHPKEIALLDEAIPLDSRQTKLEILLFSLAGSAGISVGDINIARRAEEVYATNPEIQKKPFENPRSLKKFMVSIDVFGNFEQLVEFIKKLENSGRLVDIATFALSPTDNNQLNLKLTANSYYFTQ